MRQHFAAASRVVRSGGRVSYIVGNSTFYGTIVPAEAWYAALLEEAGFNCVGVDVIRKRNSKKELFEFDVSAVRP